MYNVNTYLRTEILQTTITAHEIHAPTWASGTVFGYTYGK